MAGETYNEVVMGVLRRLQTGIDISMASPQSIALGSSTAFTVAKFGREPDVDTGNVPVDVWNGGTVYTGFPTGAAENVQVFSSSASDTGVVTILGLDGDYNRTTRTVTLTGTTPVTVSGGTMTRIHSANYNNSSGTTFNVGTITARHVTTTANVFFVMPIGRSQTAVSAYTIPAGYTGLLVEGSGSVFGSSTASVDGSFWIREFGRSPRLRRPFTIAHDSPFYDKIYGGISLPEKTDIIARITASSANNVSVTVKYDLLVVPNA